LKKAVAQLRDDEVAVTETKAAPPLPEVAGSCSVATFCGNRRRATASGDPEVETKPRSNVASVRAGSLSGAGSLRSRADFQGIANRVLILADRVGQLLSSDAEVVRFVHNGSRPCALEGA
jgi:hypothetical protein